MYVLVKELKYLQSPLTDADVSATDSQFSLIDWKALLL